jgi:hypothetical protein
MIIDEPGLIARAGSSRIALATPRVAIRRVEAVRIAWAMADRSGPRDEIREDGVSRSDLVDSDPESS